jgi:hypothetical protein
MGGGAAARAFGAIVGAALCLSTAAKAETATPAPATTYEALFKQVFEDPADLDAAFRFAGMATGRGDYEAAIGALERMLFFNPDLPRVKFELGVLYFKLGSYAMAQSYFQGAKGSSQGAKGSSDIPADVRSKIDEFLAEIDRRLSPNQFDFFAFTGVRYQTNANAGPDSLLVHALGQDAVLSSQFGRAPDWNWFTNIAARYSHDLGNQRGDSLEARFNGYYAGQFDLTNLNLGIAELEVGPRLGIFPGTSINFYGIGEGEILADQPYMEGFGAGVALRSNIAGVATIEPALEYRHRDYHNSDPYPNASEQSGELVSASLSIGGALGAVNWVGRLGYDHNQTFEDVNNYNSYERISYDLGLPFQIRLLWSQWRIMPLVGGSVTSYAEPNMIVDPNITREDTEFHYGVAFETQITKSIGFRGQVMQSTTTSSLPNYATNNLSAVMGLTYRN